MSEAKVKRYVVRCVRKNTVIIDELVGSFGSKGTHDANVFIYQDRGESLWIHGCRIRATPAAAIRFSVGVGRNRIRVLRKAIVHIRKDLKKLTSCKAFKIVKTKP